MVKVVGILIWTSLVAAMLFGFHYYLWIRFTLDLALPRIWVDAIGYLFVCSALFMPLGMGLSRVTSKPWSDKVAYGAYVWMGFVFIVLVGMGLWEVPKWALVYTSLVEPDSVVFLNRVVATLTFLVSIAAAIAALVSTRRGPIIKRLQIDIPRWPKQINGTSLVQISDVHVGPTIKRPQIEALVHRINALKPDLVVITGDLVDGSVDDLRDCVAPLANLHSTYGTFFVTGNHEYYSGVDSWLAELGALGIRVLRNECVCIGTEQASFDLAGVDDATAHYFGGSHGADYQRALQNHNPDNALIFLAHQPRQIYKLNNDDIDLMLSGHTHGGQIWPFGLLVRLVQPYMAGLINHNGTRLYISRGTGYWGPPMRLKAPAEIAHFTLSAP